MPCTLFVCPAKLIELYLAVASCKRRAASLPFFRQELLSKGSNAVNCVVYTIPRKTVVPLRFYTRSGAVEIMSLAQQQCPLSFISQAVVAAVPELGAPKNAAAPLSRPTQSQTPLGKGTPTQDWSPLNDGILVSLPSQLGKAPSLEDVNAYIHHFFYGPKAIRRLPIFTEIADP